MPIWSYWRWGRKLLPLSVVFLVAGLSLPTPGLTQANLDLVANRTPSDPVYAAGRVHLVVQNAPLDEVLKRLILAGAPLVYPSHLVVGVYRVSCDCMNVTLGTALDQLLRGTKIGYRQVRETGQVALVPALEPATPARAAGTVRGRVISAADGTPLVGADLQLVGTDRRTTTGQDGRYILPAVPAGSYWLRASRIGFYPDSQRVVVRDDTVHTVNFQLRVNPVTLNPLEVSVSTGTLIDTEKRALGNSVAVVTEDEIRQSGATDLIHLLRGMRPGVTSATTTAVRGAGGHIQIRGVSSFLLDQAPLVYVDGMPIDNSSSALRNRMSTHTESDFGAHIRLDEIPLDQIERIEIIKGPAAATLYGSEAANGVIQIFTKQGVAGPTRVVVSAEQGMSSLNHKDSFTELSRFGGQMRSLFRDPRNSRYNATISGGQGSLTYSIGLSHHSNQGAVIDNGEDMTGLHLSFGRKSDDRFSLRISGNFIKRSYVNRNYFGIFSFVESGPEHTPMFGTLEEYLRRTDRTETDVRRVYGSIDLNWQPFNIWQNRFTFGIDQSLEENETLNGTGFDGKWQRSRVAKDFNRISARYVGAIRYPQGRVLNSVFSFGAEARRDGVHQLEVWANGLPAAGIDGFPFANQTMVPSETSTAIGIVGFFVQDQVSIHDKLYITAGIRADGSSTFGSDFGLQLYPKLSAAYIIDPTSWLQSKFRVAWGRSGQLPEPFAHELTFRLDRHQTSGLPILSLSDIGNSNLKAEVGSEIEVGMEHYFFGNRAALEVNYYRQKTTDAMLRTKVSPFFGVAIGPLVNIGELRSQGIEVSGHVTALDRPALSLRLGFNLTHMIENGVVKRLGGNLKQLDGLSDQQWLFLGGIKEGRSMRDLHFRSFLASFQQDKSPWDNHVYLGSTVPTTYGGFNTDLQLLRSFRLTSYWNYGFGGHGIDWNRVVRDLNARLLSDSYDLQPEVVTERYVFRSDHLRFDALRATYTLPPSLLRGVVSHAEIWAEGRNLALFDLWPNADPTNTTVEGGQGAVATGVNRNSVPRPRDYVLGLRVTF